MDSTPLHQMPISIPRYFIRESGKPSSSHPASCLAAPLDCSGCQRTIHSTHLEWQSELITASANLVRSQEKGLLTSPEWWLVARVHLAHGSGTCGRCWIAEIPACLSGTTSIAQSRSSS